MNNLTEQQLLLGEKPVDLCTLLYHHGAHKPSIGFGPASHLTNMILVLASHNVNWALLLGNNVKLSLKDHLLQILMSYSGNSCIFTRIMRSWHKYFYSEKVYFPYLSIDGWKGMPKSSHRKRNAAYI